MIDPNLDMIRKKKKNMINKETKTITKERVKAPVAVALAILALGLSAFAIFYTSSPNPQVRPANEVRMAGAVSGGGVSALQTAINNASCGDTISVAPGNYTTTNYNQKLRITKNCTNKGTLIIKATTDAVGNGIATNKELVAPVGTTALVNGFLVTGASNVTIEGFEITIPATTAWNAWAFGSGVAIYNNSNNIQVKNNYIHDTQYGGIMLETGANNNKVSNNLIIRGGTGAGVVVYGTSNTIENNDISHTIQHPLCKSAAIASGTAVLSVASGPDADGIKIEGSWHVIRGNYIHDIMASDDGNSCRIWNATTTQYENSSLPHFDGIQLSASGAHDLTFEKNIIDLSNIYVGYKDDDSVDSCQTAGGSDIPRRHQGCRYTAGGESPAPLLPATVYDSVNKKDVCIINGDEVDMENCCEEGCYTGGIYIDGGGTGIVNVKNNIIRACQPVGLHKVNGGSVVNNTLIQGSPIDSGHGIQIYSNSTGIQIADNIIYGASVTTKYEHYLGVSNSTSITASNNLYYNISGPINIDSSGREGAVFLSSNDVVNANPLFTNYTNKDYSLLASSPAIDRGASTGLTEDFTGVANSRPSGAGYDIGAYEYLVTVCTPNCTGKTCGADGCSGSCGSCTSPATCQSGNCVCTPTASCGARVCGIINNGCENVSCGTCGANQTCDANGACQNNVIPINGGWSAWSPSTCPVVCGTGTQTRTCTNPTPANGGNNCTGDSSQTCLINCPTGNSCISNACVTCETACPAGRCGTWVNSCGQTLTCSNCPTGQTCDANSQCQSDACTPTTCLALGKSCGIYSDGCSGTLNCGTCTSPSTCNNGVCSCTPSCTGKACGASDGCGSTCKTGTCATNYTCNNGTCKKVCNTSTCTGSYWFTKYKCTTDGRCCAGSRCKSF